MKTLTKTAQARLENTVVACGTGFFFNSKHILQVLQGKPVALSDSALFCNLPPVVVAVL